MTAPRPLEVPHEVAVVATSEALDAFLTVVQGLDDEALQAASACRGWTVGDVAVHVHLGIQDLALGLLSPAPGPPDTDAAAYWRAEPPGDGDGVAQVRFVRLLTSAYRRPRGAVDHLAGTLTTVRDAVTRLPAGHLAFQGHVMTTGSLLATWAVELAVHQLDLRRELDLPEPPASALRLARATVEALVGAPLPSEIDDARGVLLGAGRARPDDAERWSLGESAGRLPVLG